MTKKKSKEQSPATAADEPQRFDEILGQLQAIVERLESAELPLETSLQAFERGMELSRRGQQILDQAEERIEVLLADGSLGPLEGRTND